MVKKMRNKVRVMNLHLVLLEDPEGNVRLEELKKEVRRIGHLVVSREGTLVHRGVVAIVCGLKGTFHVWLVEV